MSAYDNIPCCDTCGSYKPCRCVKFCPVCGKSAKVHKSRTEPSLHFVDCDCGKYFLRLDNSAVGQFSQEDQDKRAMMEIQIAQNERGMINA